MYIIEFHIKFVLIINKNYEIRSNGLANILKVFRQVRIKNALRPTIETNKIRMNHYIFFKIFFNKYILISEIRQIKVLDLGYKKKNLKKKDHVIVLVNIKVER